MFCELEFLRININLYILNKLVSVLLVFVADEYLKSIINSFCLFGIHEIRFAATKRNRMIFAISSHEVGFLKIKYNADGTRAGSIIIYEPSFTRNARSIEIFISYD